MSVPSFRNLYRVYYVGKIAYTVYTGVPIWGWAAYEIYTLSKNIYFTPKRETSIITVRETCACEKKSTCDCDDEDIFIEIT